MQPNEILVLLQMEPVHYWRDKAGHEVDFENLPGLLRRLASPVPARRASDKR
jgi:hypothetical protein